MHPRRLATATLLLAAACTQHAEKDEPPEGQPSPTLGSDGGPGDGGADAAMADGGRGHRDASERHDASTPADAGRAPDANLPQDAGKLPPASDGGGDAAQTQQSAAALIPARVQSTTLAPMVGQLATPAAGQEDIGFYGADLGITFRHGDEMRMLFGDSYADELGSPISEPSDDAQASVSLAPPPLGFPDGDAVDAFVAAQSPAAGLPSWHVAGPPLVFRTDSAGRAAPITLYRGGDHGQEAVSMGLGRVVSTAFSNGRDGAFAIFRRDAALPCDGSAEPRCPGGFSCDTGLGFCSDTSGELAEICQLGSNRCGGGATCERPQGGGLCQDPTSSMFIAGDEDGRLMSVVVQHELGVADPDVHERYYTQRWATNKFRNPIAKTVRRFDPGAMSFDYRSAVGTDPAEEKVLMWGRPFSVGIKATGQDSRLYFAYLDMPEYDEEGAFAWQPRFFAGLNGDAPQFSPHQADAVALDLSGEPTPAFEEIDFVDKMSISYIESLGRWVMLYGGDAPPAVLLLWAGPNYGRIARDPQGAIYARFAVQPWGPWGPPISVLEAGNPDTSPPLAGTEFAPGGMLHHDGCRGVGCAPDEVPPVYVLTPYGFLYTPNIMDEWTEARGSAAVDIYWQVSTWAPYATTLVRTRFDFAAGP